MTYVGQQPATTFDAGIQDRFTGLTTNTVTLTHEIAAEEDILVVWNNIVQDKNTYSVGGTGNKTVTLGGTLVSADVVTVYYLNKVMQSVNPTAGSVNTTQLADDAVSLAKLSATGTASSSNFLRGDNSWATPSSGLFGSVGFMARLTSDLTLNDATTTDVVFQGEIFDTNSAYNTSNGEFTVPVAGKYLFGVMLTFGDAEGNMSDMEGTLTLAGTNNQIVRAESTSNGTTFTKVSRAWSGIVANLSASDVVKVKANADTNNSTSSYLAANDYQTYFWGVNIA